jgi:IS1 family transposase
MRALLALCRRTRQIIAFAIGDRSDATCRILWSRLPKGYRAKRTYPDFWHAYKAVVPGRNHWPVGKEEDQTNDMERFNNTLRQRLGRFTGKTLSFSKCGQMHEMCLRLFLHEYNQTCQKLLPFRQT